MGTTCCYTTNANSRGQSSSTYITYVPKLVHIYTTNEDVNQFYIGYIINPSLHINKIFKTKVEKFLGCYFSIETIQTIKNSPMNKNTSVMAPIMIYGTFGIPLKRCLES